MIGAGTGINWVSLAHHIFLNKYGDLSFLIVFFETDIGGEHYRKVIKKLLDNSFFLRNHPQSNLKCVQFKVAHNSLGIPIIRLLGQLACQC